MSANADQIVYWNEVSGAKWVANQARLDRLFTPLTRALIDAAAPRAGERVLDVGCGCGETSLRAAGLVGAGGHVLGVDISQPMLDHARTRSSAVEWLQADAMTHAFPPEADLLMSRFGVMFFADQAAAFGNLRRALKPAGRFAFLCWQPRADVEWMQWPLDQVASVLPARAATAGEPGPFGLADATASARMLGEAGFSQVRVTSVEASLALGAAADPVDDAMALLLDTGPVATLLREAGTEARPRAEAMLRRALQERSAGGLVQLGGACWLYQGRA